MAQISMRSILAECLEAAPARTYPHVWLNEFGQLVVGAFPTPSARFDFGAEVFISYETENGSAVRDAPQRSPEDSSQRTKTRVSLVHLAPRFTGKHEIETEDKVFEFGSATQTLIHGLPLIDERAPGTLERLSTEKRRSKRPVAKDRHELYDLPSQARYAHQMENGYWVATNNKGHEALGYVRRAIELAGLEGKWFVR